LVLSWDNSGQEFFDPKEEGCGPLAKITNQPVLYKPASVSRVRPSLGTIGYAEISGLAGTGGIDGPMVSRFAS
jgi:hypothetical protein